MKTDEEWGYRNETLTASQGPTVLDNLPSPQSHLPLIPLPAPPLCLHISPLSYHSFQTSRSPHFSLTTTCLVRFISSALSRSRRRSLGLCLLLQTGTYFSWVRSYCVWTATSRALLINKSEADKRWLCSCLRTTPQKSGRISTSATIWRVQKAGNSNIYAILLYECTRLCCFCMHFRLKCSNWATYK